MQRTRYRREVLEFILGPAAENERNATEGTLSIRWSCGCRAGGMDWSAVAIVPCAEHAPEFANDESD